MEAFSFVFAMKASELYSEFWPYGIWLMFFILSSYFAYIYIPIRSVVSMEAMCTEHEFKVQDRLLSVLFGKPFKCQKCGCVFVYSRGLISLLTIIEIFSFVFAIAGSALYKSFWPYMIWLLFFALCSYVAYKFFPIRKIV
jgi:hypothetical protein